MNKVSEIDKVRSLSQIISPSNFKKIVKDKDYYSTLKSVKKYYPTTPTETNLDVINSIYKLLLKSYKNEYVYKNLLINNLLIKRYSLKTTIALSEFNIGKSIADFVLLNGEAKVYEIKTELDSLDKLEKQISDYTKFADKVYIVSNAKFTKKLLTIYSESNVGIIELTNRNALRTIKKAVVDNSNFSYEILFKTLRKNEYLELIRDHFGSIPEVPNTIIFKECYKLAKLIEISLFQKMVISKLKLRNISNFENIKSKSTPDSLKHICYTLNFSKDE